MSKCASLPLLPLLFLLLGCPSDRAVTIGEDAHNTTVSIEHGTILRVRLPSNATTGFAWKVIKNDASQLSPIGKADYQGGAGGVGAGGHEVFQFAAKVPGKTVLELHYVREGDRSPSKPQTYRVTVQVQSRGK